jgi:hypothetical protein
MRLVDRAPVVIAILVLLTSAEAAAQSAAAEALFHEGRKLVKAGKVAAGCDKLEASDRIESSVGTLLNLGDCREQLGEYASAWVAFHKAEAMARRNGKDERRAAEARRRAAALEPKLQYLVIEVGTPVEGMKVRRGDVEIDAAAWGTPLPVDPGTYPIVVEAPGHKAWTADVTFGKKTRRRVISVPALEREPEREPPPPPRVSQPLEPEPVAIVTRRDAPSPSTWTPARKVSLAIAAVGAGALGGGIYFGLRADDLQEQSDERCPSTLCGDPEGLRLNDEAQDAGRRANLLFAGGGVAIAAAAVIWFVGGPSDDAALTPHAGDGEVGLSFAGRF